MNSKIKESYDLVLKRIHHINFVVRDLERSVEQYEQLFGIQFDVFEDHPKRPVKTARVKIGDVWLVLVQPVHADCEPGKILADKGEGFFLISYEVDDLPSAIDTIKSKGGEMKDPEARQGISNWRVADLDPGNTFGVLTQICQEQDN